MKYTVILADCPWKFENPMGNESKYGGTPYHQMELEDLKALPIKDIAAKNCVLFMWATHPKMKEALEVMEAWDFQFKTIPFLWVKLNPNGSVIEDEEQKEIILQGGVYSGLGHWTAGNAEPVLLGTNSEELLYLDDTEYVLMGKKGAPKRESKKVKQVIFAPRGKHSRKPAEVRTRIEALMGDVPRIELFATETPGGWDFAGNEVDGLDIRDSLAAIINK